MVIRKKDLKASRRTRGEELREEPVEESRLHRVKRRSSAKRVFGLTILVIILLVAGWFATKVALGGWNWDGGIKSLFTLNTSKLLGEESGRVNVLLLGIPGGGPEVEGPNLTDTVMVASLNVSDKSGMLFSLPRDLFVKVPGFGDSKLNAVYEIGNAEEGNEGGELAADVVGQVLGLDIPYYIRIDFSGFAKLIDEGLGGIDVTVDKDLYDDKYPGPGKTFEVVNIKAGTYTMDGAMALKYARSRQSTSDFDRARRQQQVILAMRETAMKINLLTNPTKALAVLDLLTDSIQTNLTIAEMKRALELTRDFDATQLVTKVFDDSPTGLLYGTRAGELYVLKPVGDDFKTITDYVAKIVSGSQSVESADQEMASTEPLKVEVLNGTNVTGLAGKISTKLKAQSYNVVSTGNNATKGFTKTMVYDLSEGKREWEVKRLASSLNAEIGTDKVTTTTTAEVRVVLGTEASSL
ncbi:LCP family protein [Patescibacteria group bacterium]|nr:LCP family protein [Patescibacteria group bacterium]